MRRFEQTQKDKDLQHKTGEFNLLSISWDDSVYTWRKWSEKHKNRHRSGFMNQKGKCLTDIQSHSGKLTVLRSLFCTFLSQLSWMRN